MADHGASPLRRSVTPSGNLGRAPTTAIRAIGVGRAFGLKLELEDVSGAMVWRHILGILGAKPKLDQGDGIQRGVMAVGPALKDVSFEIERGSVVGFAGMAASVETLLRILSGMTAPTEGRVELHGAVSGLLKAGDNLEPALTARENIEAQRWAKRLGPLDAEVYARDVIAFAGLEAFEHIMVRRYSTGMMMRLSLALALHGKPDILILGNMLGVGDIAFQQKVVERLQALKAAGCTIVLELDEGGPLYDLATRVITLEDGSVVGDEVPGQIPSGKGASDTAEVTWRVARTFPENNAIALRAVTVVPAAAGRAGEIEVSMDYDVKLAPQRCRPSINVFCRNVRLFRSLYPRFIDIRTPQSLRLAVRLPVPLLGNGSYVVATACASLHGRDTYSIKHESAATIEVKRGGTVPDGTATRPLLTPDLPWEIERLGDGA